MLLGMLLDCCFTQEIELEIGMLGNHFRKRWCTSKDNLRGRFHRLASGGGGCCSETGEIS
jgi:hypothetical protein